MDSKEVSSGDKNEKIPSPDAVDYGCPCCYPVHRFPAPWHHHHHARSAPCDLVTSTQHQRDSIANSKWQMILPSTAPSTTPYRTLPPSRVRYCGSDEERRRSCYQPHHYSSGFGKLICFCSVRRRLALLGLTYILSSSTHSQNNITDRNSEKIYC